MASARKKNKEEEKIELVFYGTSVSKNALWIENYDFLQFKMCDLFENWSQVRKVSHFVHKNISEEELNRRVFAFGDSDGTIFPYLIKDNKKYRLSFDTDHPDRHSHWLHGKRFVID